MQMQVVLQKTDNKVLRFGYCEFENDGSFDSETEKIIEKHCNVDMLECDWYYDEETGEFVRE